MSDAPRSSEKTADERAIALLDATARAATAGGSRLSAAMVDLFRPEGERLSDFQRNATLHLLDQAVGAIEDELRVRLLARKDLPESLEFRASLGAAHVPIARPILDRSAALRDAELVGALLRRGEEYAIVSYLRKHVEAPDDGVLDELPSQDGEIARAAMTLLIAESRRNDRFEEPVLARADLPAPVERRLVWRVAAALRDYGVRQHGLDGALLDAVTAGEAGDMLTDRSSSESLEQAAHRLADLIDQAGMLDDALLAEALGGARIALYAALLARRAALPYDAVRELAADPASHLVLLRAAGVGRDIALRLALVLDRALGREIDESAAADQAEGFDALSAEDAAAAVRPWRFDSGYRAALAELTARRSENWR